MTTPLQFVAECYKTQEICVKAVDTCSFVFNSVRDRYKTQEMSDKVFSKEPFTLKYCLHRCKTQDMCDKVVDLYLLILKFIPDWFIMCRMIEKHDNALFSNDDIVFGDIVSDIVTFFSNDIDLNSININNINLDDDIFHDYLLEIINHVTLVGWVL